MTPKKVSEQIREAMLSHGVSVNQIAKACKIPQPSLSRFANGSELRSATLDRLAQYLGLEIVKSVDPSAPKRPTKKSPPKGK